MRWLGRWLVRTAEAGLCGRIAASLDAWFADAAVNRWGLVRRQGLGQPRGWGVLDVMVG